MCLLILCATIISLYVCHHKGINLFVMNASDSLILSYLLETQFKASNRLFSLSPSLIVFFCLSVCLKLIDIGSSGIVVAKIMAVCYRIEEKKIRMRHDLILILDTFRRSSVLHNHLFRQLDVFR